MGPSKNQSTKVSITKKRDSHHEEETTATVTSYDTHTAWLNVSSHIHTD